VSTTNDTGAAGIGRPSSLPDLVDALAVLPPLERARLARLLADRRTQGVLAAMADAAVVEVTRSQTYDEVAAALGVSYGAVRKAVVRHNARVRSEGPDS